jgi:succinate dehydrogenase / fumarate reductase cytochrome b subunit
MRTTPDSFVVQRSGLRNVSLIVVLALIWAYLHHFIAGVRHLWMDATHSVSKQQGRISAIVTLAASGVLTVLLGAKLFGLY